MKKIACLSLLLAPLSAFAANPKPSVQMLESRFASASASKGLADALQKHVDVTPYRQVKAQVIFNARHQPDHLLVHLLAKGFHRVELMSVALDRDLHLG